MSIILLKADKSAGIVVANRTWYINQMNSLLHNTDDYIRIPNTALPAAESFYEPLIILLSKHGQLKNKNGQTRIASYMLQLQNKPLRIPIFMD
jgi:hypothetical protein